MVPKTFPRKQVPTKNFHQKPFGRKFFILAKSFPRKQVPTKNLQQTFILRQFLMVTKSFPQKKFPTKNFQLFFGQNFFMVAKSFPRKQVPTKKCSSNNFSSKISYGSRIFSSKTGLHPKFSSKFFCRKLIVAK